MVDIVRQNFKNNKKVFDKTKKSLLKVLECQSVDIEHVGSTAIPNMFGKNIIDILIGAQDNKTLLEYRQKIANAGFINNNTDKKSDYVFFASTKEETKSGDIHIHLTISNSKIFNDFLILKKFLTNNPSKALEYSRNKKIIAKESDYLRDKYKASKSKYVTNLLNEARESYGK